MVSIRAFGFFCFLVCLSLPLHSLSESVLLQPICNVSSLEVNAQLDNELLPKLQLLQQILLQNFTTPKTPKFTVLLNSTQNSIGFFLSNFASFTQTFEVSYYADVGVTALSNVKTAIVNAIGDDFTFSGSMVLSASDHLVPNTRYLFSAIARVNSLNLQSGPTSLIQVDYLPSFTVGTVAAIRADSTPLFIDVATRYFPKSSFITLVNPALGISANLSFAEAPDPGGRPSYVFVARILIPELNHGGSYQIIFVDSANKITIVRSLQVQPPFRPSFVSISVPSVPLTGSTVRILLTNVTEPIDAATTSFSFLSSRNSSFSFATAVEASQTGPLDFFVTFRLPNVSFARTETIIVTPNRNAKAATSFSVVYTAVRLISSVPASYFFPRIGLIRVTVAVDAGDPIISSRSFTGAAASKNSTIFQRVVSAGVFEYTIQLDAALEVGSYVGNLSISANLQVTNIMFSFAVVMPPLPTISFEPATIYTDGLSTSRVSVIVRNIGDISASSDLVVKCSFSAVCNNCSAATVCNCAVESFSSTFAMLVCNLRGPPAQIQVTVNNTNTIGYGIHVAGVVAVQPSTAPRVLAVSTDRLSQLGRFPVAVAVTNFLSVDSIRINGVQFNSASNFFLTLPVVRPFTSDKEFQLLQSVKELYPLERIFEDAFFAVISRLQSAFSSSNATILLFRTPKVSNSSIVVEIDQLSPFARASVNIPAVSPSSTPSITTSVPRISMQGGTNVVVSLKQYIPITKQSDIDIVCFIQSNSSVGNVSVGPSLIRATTSEAVFQFQSPSLMSTVDFNCVIISRIDSILGAASPSASFALAVFDPRSFTLVDSSPRRFYPNGGPRIVSVSVRFPKEIPSFARANFVTCAIASAPSLDDIRLNPDAIHIIRIAIPEFSSSTIGDINIEIFSGSETLSFVVSLVPLPTSPVLLSIQGNTAIPSGINKVIIVAQFEQFVASSDTSRFMVYVPALANFSVSSADVFSDFQRTAVSFPAPQFATMGVSQSSVTLDAFVADLSSACGRMFSCVGRFTLRYFNANLASFVSMNPSVGHPSVSTQVVVILTNVQTTNLSLVTVLVGDPQKANVFIQIIGASFGGKGISSQTVITLRVSWVGNTRPTAAVAVSLFMVLDKQIVPITTDFTVLADNQPQLVSFAPDTALTFGGKHAAVFIQPAAFGFRSGSVLIDGVSIASNYSARGDLVVFSSPKQADARTSSVAFVLVGATSSVTLSRSLFYSIPPAIIIASVFPSQLSAFGSTMQLRLVNVPIFWSTLSLQSKLVFGASSTPCVVLSMSRSSLEVILSISYPALNPGFGNLEIFDASVVDFVARSSSLAIVSPTALQFVSISPSQFFLVKASQMTVTVKNFPVGATPRILFPRPAPFQDISTSILSSYFEPSDVSTTVATFLVNAPLSVNSFAVSVAAIASNGVAVSCISSFYSVTDDSVAAVVSVKPSTIQSLGGVVEVVVSGFPPSLLPSNISSTFSIMNSLRVAEISSCIYDTDGLVKVLVRFLALDVASSQSLAVSLIPQNFESRSLSFPIFVQKVLASIGSVMPSFFSDAGSDRVTVRLLNFPVISSASFVEASIGGVSASLSVTFVSSRPDITVIELRVPFLNVSSSGNFELLVNHIVAPALSLIAPIFIQVTSRAFLISPPVPLQINSNLTSPISVTVSFSPSEFSMFDGFAVDSSFNSLSTTASGEGICFSITLLNSLGKCSDIGCLVQQSGRTNYRILSKNVPYKGCITFVVTFAANAAPLAPSPPSRIQELSVLWNAFCNTPVQIGVASFSVVRARLTVSPTTGPVSGGYVVGVSLSGSSSSVGVSVSFGNVVAKIVSQTIVGTTLIISVICPSSDSASSVDLSVREGSNVLATTTFKYILGCLDYNAFCSSLPGGYIANARDIFRDPPSSSECSFSYCIASSSISAPRLVLFPSKKSTSTSTVSFVIANLFALSGSQIRVVIKNRNIILPVLASNYISNTDSFSVTTESPVLFESSVDLVSVYSDITGPNLNASFELISLVPISGLIKVLSVAPSAIPFEGTSALRLFLSNFPFNADFPVVTFLVHVRHHDVSQNFTVQSSSFHVFGNGSVVLTLRPSSVVSLIQTQQSLSFSPLLNVTAQTVGFPGNHSAFFQVRVMQRVNRQILSISASNSLSSSMFRSVANTVILIAIQGFDGPDVTVCFGFRSFSPNRFYQSCGADSEDQGCFIVRNSVFHGDGISYISVPYPRDFFSFLSSKAAVADLTVRVSDFARIDACLLEVSSRIVECGTAPNVGCLQMIPVTSPSLQSEPPSSVPFITVQNGGIITGTETFLTFSNFFSAADSVSARIGSDSGPNGFPKIQANCAFDSCTISVIVGGTPSDASLVDSSNGLTIFVRARNVTLPVKIPRIVAPKPLIFPSSISASGGGVVTVTSYRFSQLPNTAAYVASESADSTTKTFEIVKTSKTNNFATVFELRLKTPVSVGSQTVFVRSTSSNIITETFILDFFPAMKLDKGEVSDTCTAGNRMVSIFVLNLPTPLSNVESSVVFNNVPRPFIVTSSASLSFSFSCNEVVPSQVLLKINSTVDGSIRQADTLIVVPPLLLSMAFVVGKNRFPLANTSQITVQASALCSSNDAARSSSLCRTASVNTQLSPRATLDIFAIGSLVPAISLNLFVIVSSPGSTLFSFVFNPSLSATPPGLYNLVLASNSQTASIGVSVFDPVLSSICLAPSSCSINANIGGDVSIQLVNFASASGQIDAADLLLSITKLDGTSLSSLRRQLTSFSSIDNILSVRVGSYFDPTDFKNGQMIVLLNVALVSSPSMKVDVRLVLRSDPRVFSVNFVESLTSLIVTMDQPIIPKFSTDCSSIFANATVLRFGRNPVCSLSSDSAISVQFGSDATVLPGNVLSFVSGSIIPADGFPVANAFSLSPIVNAVPSEFQKPAVQIKGTRYVEGCSSASPALIVASANSPRVFVSVSWSCPACFSDAKLLKDFLSSMQTLSIAIPALIISNSKCRVNAPCEIFVTVTDFLNRNAVSAAFPIYADPRAVPDLLFAPLERSTFTPDMAIVLRTRFQFSTCFGDTSSVPVFSWKILPSPVVNVSSTSLRLFLPSNSLVPGSYQVTVTALLDGAVVSAFQTLKISSRAIVASLSAPDFVSSGSDITLSASASRDLETSIIPSRTLLFTWTCTYQNQPCLDSVGNILSLPQQSLNRTITILGSAFNLGVSGSGMTFDFNVLVSIENAGDLRVSSSSAKVTVIQDAIPTVYVASSLDSNDVNFGSSNPVGLAAVVFPPNPSVAFVWSEVSGLIPGGINAILDPAFNVRSPTIVINPSFLVAGRSYVFQAVVANNAKAAATVSVQINAAPSSGKCFIAFVQTGAVTTSSCRVSDRCSVLSRLTVSCENWMDDKLPLKYQFGYVSTSGTEVREMRLDYTIDASVSIQMPIGSHNLFVDVCDNNFACSTFTSFSENPIIISVVNLSQVEQDSIAKAVNKSVQSGDVDAFSGALAVELSYFQNTQLSGRRLLNSALKSQIVSKQISAMALKAGDIGAALTLAQSISGLSQVIREFDSDSASTLLPSLVALSSFFSPAPSNAPIENAAKATSTQIRTAGRSTADCLSSLSNVAAMNVGTNFQDMKRVETNLARAMLQNALPNQVIDAVSADQQYALRATSVGSNAAVMIKSPNPASSKAEFAFSLNVVDGSSVSVLSSFTPKSKYAASVPQGNMLVSDVADCTVTKQKGSTSQLLKAGPELGSVIVRIPFSLTASGPGSALALSQDSNSLRIAFYDETVFPPVWKYDGCKGSFSLSNNSAIFQGSCSHLTTFGILAAPPQLQTTAPPQTTAGPLPQPKPNVLTTSPPSSSDSDEFPLWAIILIPSVGGAALLALGSFFAYRRTAAVRTRAKQIVAASAWKTFANVTTIPKPASSQAVKDAELPEMKKVDFDSLVSVAKAADVSLPAPSVTSQPSEASAIIRRRQELADISATLDDVELPQASPLMVISQTSSGTTHTTAHSPNSSQLADGSASFGKADLESAVAGARQRRQQFRDFISQVSSRNSPSQLSPTRPPERARMSHESVLSRSSPSDIVASVMARSSAIRSSSSSRSQSGLTSPFFNRQSPSTNESSPQFPRSPVTSRSPLPSSKFRASSAGRATPRHALPATSQSSSLPSSRSGVAGRQRPQSLSPLTNRSNLSPANAGSMSPDAPRSTSRPGFRLPISSPREGVEVRYGQA
jgi:hypothetical protein